MTMAVCFKCGIIKFGAFVPCPECSSFPQTEDDLALSLAMTDHYFDMPTLEQMGAAVRDGKPPHLDPHTHAQIVEQIRTSGMLAKLQKLSRGQAGPSGLAKEERPLPKKPWWKFW
jgi:hypothetical protein